ncbi:MAG TPA: hypothetical protein VLB50_00935 [Ignavibacteriaceae bacterium]|nr:hypothetical protein [Ignavibacteriaceae bacterium]
MNTILDASIVATNVQFSAEEEWLFIIYGILIVLLKLNKKIIKTIGLAIILFY